MAKPTAVWVSKNSEFIKAPDCELYRKCRDKAVKFNAPDFTCKYCDNKVGELVGYICDGGL